MVIILSVCRDDSYATSSKYTDDEFADFQLPDISVSSFCALVNIHIVETKIIEKL